MSKPKIPVEVMSAIRDCVHHAIEGDASNLQDSVAWLARAAGVLYDAVECASCRGWADKATAIDQGDGPVCRQCEI